MLDSFFRFESVMRGKQSRAQSEMDLKHVQYSLTPLEFQWAAQNLCTRYAHAPAVLQNLILWKLLSNESPTPYVRRSVVPGVTMFHDPDVSCTNKCIVFAFAGKAGGLMIPTGVFLQLLPSADVDVVILNDTTRSHFSRGLPGYAADFIDLVRRLDDDFQPSKYKNVCSYGTSMGGLVALRYGLLLGTKSISVCGNFPWHVGRLIEPTGEVGEEAQSASALEWDRADESCQGMPAFDLLCACKASDAVKFVCVYGERPADRATVDHLATMFPVTRLEVSGANHNAIFTMWKQGTLRQFYRQQFVFEPQGALTA